MGFKNFRLNLIVRIIFLIIAIFLLVTLFNTGKYYFTSVFIFVVIILQTIEILRYTEKSNRDLIVFLESIKFSDFTRTFESNGLGASFDHLKVLFTNVIADFQKVRSLKEQHYFYLQRIIQHIDVSVIAFDQTGSVEIINDAAKKLFHIHHLPNINILENSNKNLLKMLKSINHNQNQLLKVIDDDEIYQLAFYATQFKIQDKSIKLVSIKNISPQLEEKELESWQKLIRVLTHEIMNSIAPIASLTSTVKNMVDDVAEVVEREVPNNFDFETIDDIKQALQTIHKRSTGLIHFVESYRNLTRIPVPNKTIYPVKIQLESIIKLFENDALAHNIELQISVTPDDLMLLADEQLIEQVIINMIKNSISAVERNPGLKKISLVATRDDKMRIIIQVIDNGQGIIDEVKEKIFIPFFTTKQQGSGIGLSLSKQIMRQHGGNITVFSVPDEKTCFTLIFND